MAFGSGEFIMRDGTMFLLASSKDILLNKNGNSPMGPIRFVDEQPGWPLPLSN
jgi:hypothetical protein